MKHLDDPTYRFRESPGDGDLPNLTARLPEAGTDAGIIAHYRRLDGQGGFTIHELAGDAQREADASGSRGHQPAGLFQRSQLPPARPAGDSRPNGAPAYYLGHPASLWLSIFSPRRHCTAPGRLAMPSPVTGSECCPKTPAPSRARKANGVRGAHQRLIGDYTACTR